MPRRSETLHRLGKRTVAALPAPATGRFDVIYWDADLPGVGLRVLASGARSWVARYRIGKSQRVVTVGKLAELEAEDARKEARRILQKAGLGQDTRAEIAKAKAQAGCTLGGLIDAYLADRAPKRQGPKTLAETERYLRHYFRRLHGTPLAALHRHAIAAELDRIALEHGRKGQPAEVTANRARTALSACIVWGMKSGRAGDLAANPVAFTIKKDGDDERQRKLSAPELRVIWQATEGSGDYNAIVRLLLLTGQRREEIGGMDREELALERAMWSLPGAPETSKGAIAKGASRTKNGLPHDVPLSQPALDIVEAISRPEGRTLVFGRGEGGFQGWSNAKEALDRRIARLRAEERLGRSLLASEAPAPADALPEWRLHDLRRTVVTGMNDMGIQPHVVEAVVNHVSGAARKGVAGIYNRATYAAEKRSALTLWAEHVMALVADEPAKVVPLRRAAS